jgi:hypothetical protein
MRAFLPMIVFAAVLAVVAWMCLHAFFGNGT